MDIIDYLRNHPPRRLAGFTVEPANPHGVTFDGHLSMSQLPAVVPPDVTVIAPEHINPIFFLSCRCGGRQHYVHCYRWANPNFRNELVTLSPLDLECAACGRKMPLLDTNIHGYDGEMGHGSCSARAEGEHTAYECPTCGRQPFETFVRCEYPDDLFDGDYDDFAGRQQDLFTWFSLVGRCSQCSVLLQVADFECA